MDELESERALIKRLVDCSFVNAIKTNLNENSEHIYINEWETTSDHEEEVEPEKVKFDDSKKQGGKEIPGLHLSKREKKTRRRKAKKEAEKTRAEKKDESEHGSSEKINDGKIKKVTDEEELVRESKKIVEVLRIAKIQHQSYMEDTWEERIPLECSTPKMLSCIGKQIEQEIRRNSISLASGFKRKCSPLGNERINQRKKYNSSKNIPDDLLNMSKEQNKEDVEIDNCVISLQGHEEEHGKKSDQDPMLEGIPGAGV